MSYYENADERRAAERRLVTYIVLAVFGCVMLTFGGCWAVPHYNVWQQGLAGEAELARAQQNRQIAIQEAQARMESAKLLADSEVTRARGVAEANKIIAEGLGGPEGYLRWLWVDALNNPRQGTQIIYVPTEAGLPILEAGKR